MKAGIYARISQDSEGQGQGVRRQIEDCEARAQQLDWTVIDRYVDNDISATRSRSRPEYQRLMADLRNGRIEGLIVWAIDRLTRTPRELEDIIDLAERRGLKLVNLRGDIDLATSQGRGMARMLGTFARMETEAMSTRLQRKYEDKARKGEPHGYPPYGFERRFVSQDDARRPGAVKLDFVVPEQADVIREAAARVLARESLRSIAGDLNRRAIASPKGGQWSSTILKQILVRPANAGLRVHRGQVIGKSASEAIYSPDLHDQLCSLLKDSSRKSNHVGPSPKYLLSGLARCGLCDGTLRRQVGRAVKPTRPDGATRQAPSYACSNCFRLRCAQEPLDDLISSLVVRRLSQSDARETFVTRDSAAAGSASDEIARLQLRLDALSEMYADDAINPETFRNSAAKLERRLEVAKAQLSASTPSDSVLNLVTARSVREEWDGLPVSARREVLQSLMEVVILPAGSGKRFSPDRVQVRWRTSTR